jgi:hypothetical protein
MHSSANSLTAEPAAHHRTDHPGQGVFDHPVAGRCSQLIARVLDQLDTAEQEAVLKAMSLLETELRGREPRLGVLVEEEVADVSSLEPDLAGQVLAHPRGSQVIGLLRLPG